MNTPYFTWNGEDPNSSMTKERGDLCAEAS
jgi:hypothetical protein